MADKETHHNSLSLLQPKSSPPHRIRLSGDWFDRTLSFAVTEILTDCPSGWLVYPRNAAGLDSDCFKSAGVTAMLVELVQLKGIASINVGMMQMDIEIGPAFDWTDVNDAIVEIITRHLFAGEAVDVQDRVQNRRPPPPPVI